MDYKSKIDEIVTELSLEALRSNYKIFENRLIVDFGNVRKVIILNELIDYYLDDEIYYHNLDLTVNDFVVIVPLDPELISNSDKIRNILTTLNHFMVAVNYYKEVFK